MIFSIWISAITIQIVITIFQSTQFARYRKEIAAKPVSISVVVAARNELENLKKLIPKLLSQTHINFEIIIILDRCNDSSAQFLRNQDLLKIKIIEIDETPEGWDHKKHALTQGVGAASGAWIVFTDADCIPASNEWLHRLNSRITASSKILLGYSPYKSTGTLLQTFIQFEGFLTAFNYLSMALLRKPYMGVGRNLAIEKSFFLENHGYSDFKSVVGGDDDLFIQKNANSKNTEIFVGFESLVFTMGKQKWAEYVSQKIRHLSVGGAYSLADQLLHLFFGGSLFLAWTLIPFIRGENILPIILFYLFIKAIGYRFAHSKMGVGFNYIWLPLVELMYAVFLPVIAIRSKFVKDIRWKN
ncbi:MAG: glycosyltransferase [Cyclobacteriaceae bacterium]